MAASAPERSIPRPRGFQPSELDLKRIERALQRRKRYRYVSPSVRVVEEGYLIESPCCSRNVDRDGGRIDIARLEYEPATSNWALYRKQHAQENWVLHGNYRRLADLLEELNADPLRLFWQ